MRQKASSRNILRQIRSFTTDRFTSSDTSCRKCNMDIDVVKFVSKLKSASKDLFTFTLHHNVELTNSHAERQLREPIVHRKIRGQLKSEKGIVMFSRLLTVVSTWKLQDMNPFVEFKKCPLERPKHVQETCFTAPIPLTN